MSTISTTHCDSPDCRNSRTDNTYGWVKVSQGASHQDFCSWACVAEFAKVRWEPKTPQPARRRSDKPKPVEDVKGLNGAPYLRDAVQPPLPGVE
jgi:hypothetical protein